MNKPRKDRVGMFQTLAGLAGRPQPLVQPPPPKEPPPPSRKDKKGFTVWLEPEVIRAIKQLAVETDLTQEKLVREALNLLFKSKGKPPLA
jgi:hypothetical protein